MAVRKRNKFRAVRTNGYSSKFESKVAGELERYCVDNGFTLHEQHKIKFACGAAYICDFVVCSSSTGAIVSFVEAKGKETPVWRLKLRMLKHEFPDIHENLTIVFNRNKGGKLTPKWGGWVK